jgi:carbon storage regulator
MLIVSRRKGQRIKIGHDIEVVVTEISRSCVKIGIQAPTSHTILRGEVHEAIENANRQALEADLDPSALNGAPVGAAVNAAPAPVADELAPSPATEAASG